MALTKITGDNIQPGSITTVSLAEGAGGGPKISNVSIANSAYSVLDDTAIALDGGYLVITGTGFAAGCQVVINSNNATSVTFVNSTTIRAQVGAADAGTKTVYVVNTDGGTAIRVNGLTYSATPTWVTGSTLTEGTVDEAISIQLDASLATSYQIQTGSSLPAGLSLAANGLLSGTVTGIEEETTYNFIVEAIDAENQESPRSFSITITAGEPYFYLTTLLLNGDGTNGAQNNTFIDSSNNNFTVTRSGNTTQGAFSPFSQPDGRWSAYFDGNGDNLQLSGVTAVGNSNVTIEFWIYPTDASALQCLYDSRTSVGTNTGFGIFQDGRVIEVYGNGLKVSSAANALNINAWNHVALTRSSGTCQLFINGVSSGSSGSYSSDLTSTVLRIGDAANSLYDYIGYISNSRTVIGSVIYSGSTYTVPTSPLTAISGTAILTCQSNRFRDNSSNNFAITRNGDVRVTPFSPFAPTAAYSPSVNGGSGYFDGSGDYLVTTSAAALAIGTSAFTLEGWCYFNNTNTNGAGFGTSATSSDSSGDRGVSLFLTGSGAWRFRVGRSVAGQFEDFLGTTTLVAGQWYHFKMIRTSTGSNDTRIYLNGVQEAIGTSTISLNMQKFSVGTYTPSDTSGALLNGYAAGIRFTNTAESSAIPTSPPTAVSGTQYLVNFTNGGITDATGRNNLETVGDARLDTSIKKYGTGSIKFDGTGDYLNCRMTPELSLGSGNFTIEAWLYFTGVSGDKGIVSNFSTITGPPFQAFGINIRYASSLGGIRSVFGGGSLADAWNTSWSPSTNTWYHFAATRSGNSYRIFINGTQIGSTETFTNATTIVNASDPSFSIGTAQTVASSDFQGFIDDLRITTGIARYTTNFTPPVKALPQR